jgi:hypothetical protein
MAAGSRSGAAALVNLPAITIALLARESKADSLMGHMTLPHECTGLARHGGLRHTIDAGGTICAGERRITQG